MQVASTCSGCFAYAVHALAHHGKSNHAAVGKPGLAIKSLHFDVPFRVSSLFFVRLLGCYALSKLGQLPWMVHSSGSKADDFMQESE